MNILVTGSNGFIGSHIVHRLVEQGHEVFGLVTPFEATEVYYMKLLQGSKVLSGDLRDRFSLDLAVREANPEIIFHLGALTSVGQSFRNPEVFSDTN
jgi:nucleoside-diphosphate-sugar epimerase